LIAENTSDCLIAPSLAKFSWEIPRSPSPAPKQMETMACGRRPKSAQADLPGMLFPARVAAARPLGRSDAFPVSRCRERGDRCTSCSVRKKSRSHGRSPISSASAAARGSLLTFADFARLRRRRPAPPASRDDRRASARRRRLIPADSATAESWRYPPRRLSIAAAPARAPRR
jgi:hypothetical protein